MTNVMAELGTMPRTPECAPWCVRHGVTDDGEVNFCLAEDLPTYVREAGGRGYVGLTQTPGDKPLIDLAVAGGSHTMTVEEAAHVVRQLIRQIDRARGKAGK